ncbi:MAG: alanine racemase, partial [Planctomycetota bacterium]
EPELARQLLEQIDACPNLELAGVYTHFATADEEDLSYAYEQQDNYERFLTEHRLKDRGILIHAANSASTIKMPRAHKDMVR